MKLHHTGYLVRNLEQAENEFVKLGFLPEGESVSDQGRKIRIRFMTREGHRIELVQPEAKDSAAGGLLKKTGGGPYHLCFETGSLQADAERMEKEGYVRISGFDPAPAIGMKKVVFLLHPAIGIVELLEK